MVECDTFNLLISNSLLMILVLTRKHLIEKFCTSVRVILRDQEGPTSSQHYSHCIMIPTEPHRACKFLPSCHYVVSGQLYNMYSMSPHVGGPIESEDPHTMPTNLIFAMPAAQ